MTQCLPIGDRIEKTPDRTFSLTKTKKVVRKMGRYSDSFLIATRRGQGSKLTCKSEEHS